MRDNRKAFWDGFVAGYASEWHALALFAAAMFGVFLNLEQAEYGWVTAFAAMSAVAAILYIAIRRRRKVR